MVTLNILYILTHQVGSAYTVQVMSDEAIAQQESDYLALRQERGEVSPAVGRYRFIPGIRTVAQAEENCKAMAFGPLKPAQMEEIE